MTNVSKSEVSVNKSTTNVSKSEVCVHKSMTKVSKPEGNIELTACELTHQSSQLCESSKTRQWRRGCKQKDRSVICVSKSSLQELKKCSVQINSTWRTSIMSSPAWKSRCQGLNRTCRNQSLSLFHPNQSSRWNRSIPRKVPYPSG